MATSTQTLLQLCDRVSKRIFLPTVSEVMSSTSEDVVQLFEVVREAGEMILSRHQWKELLTTKTFTGADVTDGGDYSYIALESDYDRMATQLWDTTLDVPCWGPLNEEEWESVIVRGSSSARPYWTLEGKQIRLFPEVAAADAFRYKYVSNKWIYDVSNSNARVAAFTADGDIPIFDEQLMRFAVIYKWKEEKGMAYSEAMEDFERRLETEISKDRGGSSRGISLTPTFEDVPRDWWPGVING